MITIQIPVSLLMFVIAAAVLLVMRAVGFFATDKSEMCACGHHRCHHSFDGGRCWHRDHNFTLCCCSNFVSLGGVQ